MKELPRIRQNRALVLRLIQTADSIEALAALRSELIAAIAADEIDPPQRWLWRWVEAQWVRVLELMARDPAKAEHIHRVVSPWIPDSIAELREAVDLQLNEAVRRHNAANVTDEPRPCLARSVPTERSGGKHDA